MTAPLNTDPLRYNMIEQQIRPWNVLELDILEQLSIVRREDYVPAAHRSMAFFDLELPFENAKEPGQCMLSPKVEARMLQDLHVKKTDTVLEIEGKNGRQSLSLMHQWPVRKPRPVAEKLPGDEPLITGQRVLDAMFPSVLGGTCAVPVRFLLSPPFPNNTAGPGP